MLITTHDDDVNVHLAIYCRSLRDDVRTLARANQDRNVCTLDRAGPGFGKSYAELIVLGDAEWEQRFF